MKGLIYKELFLGKKTYFGIFIPIAVINISDVFEIRCRKTA